MKTRYALTLYYVVTSLLAACAIIIVGKLLLFPPCTPTGPHGSLCTVDGWSIAGLAATVLGVGAAILTILGAFAVAYWWAELDKRVNKQVTTLYDAQKTDINTRVADLLKEQETTINKQVDKLLVHQQQKIEVQEKKIEAQEHRINKANRELEDMYDRIDIIIDLAFDLANINPPWMLEDRAKDITSKFKTPEAAKHMVFNYLEYARKLTLPHDPKKSTFTHFLAENQGPSTDPPYYWQKALEWENVVEDYYKNVLGDAVVSPDGKTVTLEEPKPLKQVREAVNEYRPTIEEWMKKHTK